MAFKLCKSYWGTSDNYSTATGKRERSLCAVVAMLTDGEVAIAIDHDVWISHEFVNGVKKQNQ